MKARDEKRGKVKKGWKRKQKPQIKKNVKHDESKEKEKKIEEGKDDK